MAEQRKAHDIGPLVIHASYLINVCSQNEEVRQKSIVGFRGELERALALGADYLVLHPGSWKGLSRSHGLTLAAASITEAVAGLAGFAALAWQQAGLRILIENTAGAEFSLGSSFEQVAELVACLRPTVPVAVCLDTCHSHVAGYDLITAGGYEETVQLIEATIGVGNVRVWHSNDAKAARGSKLDRHENIGHGTMGLDPFRRLLNDARFAHAAFIAETPVDEPGDDLRDVNTLRSLVRADQ
jgi:deoxyribonuclease-4